MLRSSALLLLAAISLLGCTSTRTIELQDTNTYYELNRRAASQKVRVMLQSGEALGVEGLRVDADSASFIAVEEYTVYQGEWSRPTPLEPPRVASIAVAEISQIQFRSRNRGMGALLGAIPGALVGVVLGALDNSEPCTVGDVLYERKDNCRKYNESTESIVLGLTFTGAAVGALVGVLVGRRDTRIYRFPGASGDLR